jgi:hypothetical protein
MGAIANLPNFKLTISAQANHMAFRSWHLDPKNVQNFENKTSHEFT